MQKVQDAGPKTEPHIIDALKQWGEIHVVFDDRIVGLKFWLSMLDYDLSRITEKGLGKQGVQWARDVRELWELIDQIPEVDDSPKPKPRPSRRTTGSAQGPRRVS